MSAPVCTCPPSVRHVSASIMRGEHYPPRDPDHKIMKIIFQYATFIIFSSVADIWRTLGGEVRTWQALSCVADIWRTLGGQVRTGADMSEHHVLSSVPDIWRTFGGQVRTGADRCGQVRTTLVPGCLS